MATKTTSPGQIISILVLVWAASGPLAIAVDWGESLGLSFAAAVLTMWAAILTGAGVTYVAWLLDGRGFRLDIWLPLGGAIPPIALGAAGYFAGAASRGHLFVLAFITVVDALVCVITIAVTRQKRYGGNPAYGSGVLRGQLRAPDEERRR